MEHGRGRHELIETPRHPFFLRPKAIGIMPAQLTMHWEDNGGIALEKRAATLKSVGEGFKPSRPDSRPSVSATWLRHAYRQVQGVVPRDASGGFETLPYEFALPCCPIAVRHDCRGPAIGRFEANLLPSLTLAHFGSVAGKPFEWHWRAALCRPTVAATKARSLP